MRLGLGGPETAMRGGSAWKGLSRFDPFPLAGEDKSELERSIMTVTEALGHREQPP